MKINLLVMSAGKASGKALPITGPQFIIGRDPQCNLRPASAMISKRHCAILVKNEQVILRDMGSTNGSFVNEQQVKGEVPLKDGDILKVGPLSFKVQIEGATAPKKPTPPPKPRTAEGTDDDAAAALLSLEDDGGEITAAEGDTAQEDAVPGGSTVMEMPAFKPETPPPADSTSATPPPKTEEKKPAAAAKPKAGAAAQDAARALLEKMRSGKRPAPKE